MLEIGGIEYYEQLADKKSQEVYRFLDESRQIGLTSGNLHFKNSVDERLRSRMNIPFNICDKDGQIASESESQLLKDLKAAGFSGLKGHKSLGGLRASIYNSLEY